MSAHPFYFSFLCVRFWYNPYDISDVVNSGNVFSIYMKMGRDSYPKFWLDARNIGNKNFELIDWVS